MPSFGPVKRHDLIACLRRLDFNGPYSGGRHELRRVTVSHSAAPIEKRTAKYPGVASVEATDGYKLVLRFDNGERRVFDATPLLPFGRFRELAVPEVFKKIRVAYDTVEWENGLDLDPEYLYERSQPT